MADVTKNVLFLSRANSSNIDLLIEKFVDILNIKSIKEFNRACKESNSKNFFKIKNQ
jgi:hypothetical protein